MDGDATPKVIDLAHEATFSLGGLEVRPATLEVVADERREQLEPRIMQVLVVLARRRGEVVSRDDLIASCWGGRIVGDDALSRCIFRLRKLAEDMGGFTIDTVPRVGFRLNETGGAAGAGPRRSRPWVLLAAAGIGLVILLGAVGWTWWSMRPADPPYRPRVAVAAFAATTPDEAARAIAADLSAQVRGLLGEHALGVASPAEAASDMRVEGSVSLVGGGLRVRTLLIDTRSGVTLWSTQFEAEEGKEAALGDQVAASMIDTVYTAMDGFKQRGVRLDAAALALFIRASKAMSNSNRSPEDNPAYLYEQVVVRAPDYARGHSGLAASLMTDSSPERRARGEAAAKRALQLDPSTAEGVYDSRYLRARWFDRGSSLPVAEQILLGGIKAGPELPYVHMRECRFLIELGFTAPGVEYCARARALRPLTPPIEGAYAEALFANGQTAEARQAAARIVRFHPEHHQSRRTQFEIEAFDGAPADAARLLQDPRTAAELGPLTVAALDAFLRARASGVSADADRAIVALWAAATKDERLADRYLVLCAAALKRPDDAFRALDRFGVIPRLIGPYPGWLLERQAASLRGDPRFWRAAARAGYLQYWREKRRWPDFCTDRAVGIDCPRAAAAAGV